MSTSATPLQSVPAFSPLQCAIQCHTLPSCWAFNHRSSGLCQLLPRDLQLCQVSGELQPLTAEEGGMFGMPAVGCAVRTCMELLQLNVTATSGVYRLPGWPVPVYCDQQLDGGGWTLMVSSVSQTWTPDGSGVTLVTGRNTETPSIEDDYSILGEGDRVIRYGTGDRFLYRLEGQVETGRRRWGGIWSAPRSGSIVRHAPDVTTQMVQRFSHWEDTSKTLKNRLPWINTGYFTNAPSLSYVLKTSSDTQIWGTLITKAGKGFSHSPWIEKEARDSGNVLYWIRENQ